MAKLTPTASPASWDTFYRLFPQIASPPDFSAAPYTYRAAPPAPPAVPTAPLYQGPPSMPSVPSAPWYQGPPSIPKPVTDPLAGIRAQYIPPTDPARVTGEGLNVYSRPTVKIGPDGRPVTSGGTTYYPTDGSYGYNANTGEWEQKQPGQAYVSVAAPKKANAAVKATEDALTVANVPSTVPVGGSGAQGIRWGQPYSLAQSLSPPPADRGGFDPLGFVKQVADSATGLVTQGANAAADLGGQAVQAAGDLGAQGAQAVKKYAPLMGLLRMFQPYGPNSGYVIDPQTGMALPRLPPPVPANPGLRYGPTPQARQAADGRRQQLMSMTSPQAQSGVYSSGTMATDWAVDPNYHDPNNPTARQRQGY